MRTRMIMSGDVETNPGPTTLNKKVWICDICHKHIQVTVTLVPSHSHNTHTCNTNSITCITVTATTAQHRLLRQPHKQTKEYHRPTNTTQPHRPSSKSERNFIILQVNINGLGNKLEELKTAYSRHTCRHHHNSGNQAHP